MRQYRLMAMAASLGMFAGMSAEAIPAYTGPITNREPDEDDPALYGGQHVGRALRGLNTVKAAAPCRLDDPRHVPAEKSGSLQRLLAQKGRK